MTPQTSALHHHLMHTMQNEKEPGNIENLVKLIKMRRETKEFNTTSEQDLKRVCDEYIRKQLEMHAIYPGEIQRNACHICKHSLQVSTNEKYCTHPKASPNTTTQFARENNGFCGPKAVFIEIAPIL